MLPQLLQCRHTVDAGCHCNKQATHYLSARYQYEELLGGDCREPRRAGDTAVFHKQYAVPSCPEEERSDEDW
jgi:hypothetical protein